MSIISLTAISHDHSTASKKQLKKIRADVLKKEEGKMIKAEEEELKTSWKLYKKYWGNYFGGFYSFFLSMILLGGYTLFRIYLDYIVGQWSEAAD